MKKRLLNLLALSFLSVTMLSPLAYAQAESQAIILQYHHVSSDTPAATSISPEDFAEHLSYLRDNDFQILPLEVVVSALQNEQPLSSTLADKVAVITFDDAYQSVYLSAFPLLKEYDWPFTIFVTAGLVSNASSLYVSWEQLEEMAAAGATLANHTLSHPYFLNRDENENHSEWLLRIENEILEAEAMIKDRSGQNHRLLAYPYGEYNPEIQALVQSLGFVGLGQHSGPVNSASDFSALPRFPFSGLYASMNTFPVKVEALAFNIQIIEPQSSVTEQFRPEVTVEINGAYRSQQLSCYNNNERIETFLLDEQTQQYRISTHIDNNSRRFRYNCTAPAQNGSGRYYWFSIPWVNPALSE